MNTFDLIEAGANLTPSQHKARNERKRADLIARDRAKLMVNAVAPAVPKVLKPEPSKPRPRSKKSGSLFADPPITNREGLSAFDRNALPGTHVAIRRLHHLRVSMPMQVGAIGAEKFQLEDAKQLLATALKVQGQERLAAVKGRKAGLWTYDNGFVFHDAEDAELAGIFWSEGRGEFTFDVRGGGCDRMGPSVLLEVIKKLKSMQAKGRRIDPAFDDYNRVASPADIEEACKAKNYKGPKQWERRNPVKDRDTGELLGDSVNFGSAKYSDKYIRIYDKFLESGKNPDLDCLRYEVELSAEYAEAAFDALAESKDRADFELRLGGLIAASIDFIDRNSVTEAENKAGCTKRMTKLTWWGKLLTAMCASAPLVLNIPLDYGTGPLSRGLKACFKQYSKLLALGRVVLQSAGISITALLERKMDDAETKLNWDEQGRRDLALRLPDLLCT